MGLQWAQCTPGVEYHVGLHLLSGITLLYLARQQRYQVTCDSWLWITVLHLLFIRYVRYSAHWTRWTFSTTNICFGSRPISCPISVSPPSTIVLGMTFTFVRQSVNTYFPRRSEPRSQSPSSAPPEVTWLRRPEIVVKRSVFPFQIRVLFYVLIECPPPRWKSWLRSWSRHAPVTYRFVPVANTLPTVLEYRRGLRSIPPSGLLVSMPPSLRL